MSDTVIKVQDISKAYRIGMKEQRHDTLSASMASWVKSPFTNFKKLKSLTNFDNKDDEDIFWALKGINFEVKKGEVLGIIGKNGAGKSTLLKILSRITEPTDGRIEIYGRVASLLEVGTGFNPELTGRENVYLNGTILGMTKKEIDSKFDEIINFSGIEEFIDTPAKRYSSGMKVRLAFAVAAHLDPEILIIDEVLAVGDAEFQKKCMGKMGELSKGQGRTVIFVSHNMAAVKSLCTKGIVLVKGKEVFKGCSEEAVSYYLNHESENNKIELSKRLDRTGSGQFRFEGINFFNSKGQQISELINGESVKIELSYSKEEDFDASRIILSLIFRDNLKQNVTSCVSDEIFNELHISKKSGVIVLEIPQLLLRSERYEIKLLSFNYGVNEKDALDIIEDACFIDVLPGDLTGLGNVNRKGFSSITIGTYRNE